MPLLYVDLIEGRAPAEIGESIGRVDTVRAADIVASIAADADRILNRTNSF